MPYAVRNALTNWYSEEEPAEMDMDEVYDWYEEAKSTIRHIKEAYKL